MAPHLQEGGQGGVLRMWPSPWHCGSRGGGSYHGSGSPSRNPLAKGLLAIFNWVICRGRGSKRDQGAGGAPHCPPLPQLTRWFWYAVTAMNWVSGKLKDLKFWWAKRSLSRRGSTSTTWKRG